MKKTNTIMAIVLVCILVIMTACSSTNNNNNNNSNTNQPGPATPAPTDNGGEPLPYGLKSGKPYDGTELTFLICCNTAAQFIGWEDSVAEFKELTGIDVNFTWDPLAGLQQKIITQSIGNQGKFDVTIFFDTWGNSLKHLLEPLDDRIQADHIDLNNFSQANMHQSTYDGQVYGIPARSHVMMLFYRQDVLDKLDLKVPTTWAELEQTAKTISEQGGGIHGFTTNFAKQDADQNILVWLNFLQANGVDIFDEAYKPAFNSEAGIAATKQFMNLVPYMPPGALAYNEGDLRTSFASGEAAMAIAWSWSYEIFQNPEFAKPEVIAGTGFSPEIPGPNGAANPISMTWPIGISASSKNKDAAWEWIKWMSNSDLEKKMVTDKSDPKRATIVSNQYSTFNDEQVNEANNGFPKIMGEAMSNAGSKPLLPEWDQVNDILGTAITVMATGSDVQATLDSAAKDITDIMQKAGYYK